MSSLADPVGTPLDAPAPLAARPLFAYAMFGMPLAMVALPVYVLVPKFYADLTGLALGICSATSRKLSPGFTLGVCRG